MFEALMLAQLWPVYVIMGVTALYFIIAFR